MKMQKTFSLFSGSPASWLHAGSATFSDVPQVTMRLFHNHSSSGLPVVEGLRSKATPRFLCGNLSLARSPRELQRGKIGSVANSNIFWNNVITRRYSSYVLTSISKRQDWFGRKILWSTVRCYTVSAVSSNEAEQLACKDIAVSADGKKTDGKTKRKTKAKSVKKKDRSAPSIIAEENEELSSKEKIELNKSTELSTGKSKKKILKPKGKKSENESDAAKKEKPQMMNDLGIIKQGIMKPLFPPKGKSVMVVESMTKAKAIQGYLGDMYEVLPSNGHVRDLAGRSGSVRPDDEFSMVWEVPSAAWTHLKCIKVALSGAESLILASDPDREGEAIAWHITEMLKQQGSLNKDLTIARVVFHEITEASVKNALMNPRDIDADLVYAYLARRALDYLIGFNISPLLWRKLPGCQSAGRVQSAALALICDRETEIDMFTPQEYWSVEVQLRGKSSRFLRAHLTQFDDRKLNQLSIASEKEALDIKKSIMNDNFTVIGSKTSKITKNPPTPYITSTLQQDAANQLDFSAMKTMKVAQKLYEGVPLANGITGLITYMRTDGLHISNDAVNEIRSFVVDRYGIDFAAAGLPKCPKKVKNAQEAHEAIRPTNIKILPSMLKAVLEEDSLKLYTLIWCRTVACLMNPATFELVQVDVANSGKTTIFRSSGSNIAFPGYRAVYEDVEAENYKGVDDIDDCRIREFEALKSCKRGDTLEVDKLDTIQHFTLPSPRYSEGSLVKKLEELGIGRPSTYASTIKVLKDRNYVSVKSRMLHPEFRGRMVSAFLSQHFSDIMDTSFTADMEAELDNVSAGLTEWKGLLHDYWRKFKSHCTRAENVSIHQVEKMLEEKFANFLFSNISYENRTCPSCSLGTLTFKVSKYGHGYFIGCDQHPNCKYIAKTFYGEDEDDEESSSITKPADEPKLIGLHPVTQDKVLLKSGPYGNYIQLGESKKGYSSKRVSVSHISDADGISLEVALDLLRFPVTLGKHPDDDRPVVVKIGKKGYFVKHRLKVASLPKKMKPCDLTLDMALALLSGKDARQLGRPKGASRRRGEAEAG